MGRENETATLTSREVMNALGIRSYTTLRKRILNGEAPAPDIWADSPYRWDRQRFERWLKKRTAEDRRAS